MTEEINKTIFLLADDDEDYYIILKNAFLQLKIACDLRWVKDGEELMDYLLRRNQYVNPVSSPKPDLILLDINMPKKNGIEALKEIKTTPLISCIPVVMLTASNDNRDVMTSYCSGASSFITKPISFKELLSVIEILTQYWQKAVTLPQ